MSGKRNQTVLHKYLMQAADMIQVKSEPLPARLCVPEAFSESAKANRHSGGGHGWPSCGRKKEDSRWRS